MSPGVRKVGQDWNGIQRYADLASVAAAPAAPLPKTDLAQARSFLGLEPPAAAGEGAVGNLLDILAAPARDLPSSGDPGWRQLFAALLLDQKPEASAEDVRRLIGAVLHTAQKLFTNDFGDDEALKTAIAYKQRFFKDVAPQRELLDNLFGAMDVRAQQLDCLQFITRVFKSHEGDQAIRAAAIGKLSRIGGLADLPALIKWARKGGAQDLQDALHAIREITKREGLPGPRGGLRLDPEIGPLLATPHAELSTSDRTKLIEAVLLRGQIDNIRLHDGGTNLNQVYFVRFAETLGEGGPAIGGVFKPELTDGTSPCANFSREIAVYQGLEKTLRTGLIAPTVEAIVTLPGREPEGGFLGSMQYMLPNAHELGRDDDKGSVHPKFEKFLGSDKAAGDLKKIRVLCYLAGSGDHFMNSDHASDSPIYNYNNFMVTTDEAALHGLRVQHSCDTEELLARSRQGHLGADDERRLFEAMTIVPIDFGSSLGNMPSAIKPGILPSDEPTRVLDVLTGRSALDIGPRVKQYVPKHDARDVQSRLRKLKGDR